MIGALHPNGTSDLGIRDLRDRIVALERELAEARKEVGKWRTDFDYARAEVARLHKLLDKVDGAMSLLSPREADHE